MKPAHLIGIGVAVLVGLRLWVGNPPESVAFKDPLATNEFPLRFTDPIRLSTNTAAVDTPPPQPPRPPRWPALREPWQTNALNEAIHWLLTVGFKHYSRAPFTGIVRFFPHELPTNFVPVVSGFSFEPFPSPSYSITVKPDEVNLRVAMNGPWTDTEGKTIPMASGIPGEQVAYFHFALVGNVGIGTVDLNGTFGVFKTTNGYVTKNLGWFDP